ncbi:MAG: hypothetical protein QOD73_1803 [Solirubrobacteraceae bacterium]|nr:hypothetical protein [Solirubrobacteraceae bacterium]
MTDWFREPVRRRGTVTTTARALAPTLTVRTLLPFTENTIRLACLTATVTRAPAAAHAACTRNVALGDTTCLPRTPPAAVGADGLVAGGPVATGARFAAGAGVTAGAAIGVGVGTCATPGLFGATGGFGTFTGGQLTAFEFEFDIEFAAAAEFEFEFAAPAARAFACLTRALAFALFTVRALPALAAWATGAASIAPVLDLAFAAPVFDGAAGSADAFDAPVLDLAFAAAPVDGVTGHAAGEADVFAPAWAPVLMAPAAFDAADGAVDAPAAALSPSGPSPAASWPSPC